MDYRLLVLDIDGTLRAPGCPRVSRAVADAINAVQASGVKIVLATGRGRGAVAAKMLRGIRPDYYICAGGAHVLNAAGQQLACTRLSAEEMYALVDFCEDHEYALAFSYEEAYYVYVEYQKLLQFYCAAAGAESAAYVLDGEDQDRHLQSMPFAAFGVLPPAGVQAFAQKYGYLGLRFLPFDENHYDILGAATDKAVGLKGLMDSLGVPAAAVAAVGDGSNDVGMLRLAGFSAAMQNGCEAAKNAADTVCPPADQDGVAALCRMLFPAAFEQSPLPGKREPAARRAPEPAMPCGAAQ